MSYKAELKDLERDGERSLTQQIVSAFERAIESGELTAGREAAADARAGRDRRDQPPDRRSRLPTAARAGARLLAGRPRHLRPRRGRSGIAAGRRRGRARHRMAALRAAGDDREPRRPRDGRDVPPLPGPRPDPPVGRLPVLGAVPVRGMRQTLTASLERCESRALQYTDIAGLPELVEQLAALSAERGSPEDPDDLIVTSGARQGLTLAARAVLRPGDAVACEAPTFMGVLESVEVDRHPGPARPDGRRRPRHGRARGSARPRGDPLPRGAAALPEPDRPRPLARAPRAAAGARAPARLLHRRGRRSTATCASRARTPAACAAESTATSSTSTRSRRPSAAACGWAGSPPAGRCATASCARSAPTTCTAQP